VTTKLIIADDVLKALSTWSHISPLLRLAVFTDDPELRMQLWSILEGVGEAAASQGGLSDVQISELCGYIQKCIVDRNDNMAIASALLFGENFVRGGSQDASQLTSMVAALAEEYHDNEIQPAALRFIVSSSEGLGYTKEAVFWQRMLRWIDSEDEGMRACAFLVLGNATRDGK
jgi:hypothetical protein